MLVLILGKNSSSVGLIFTNIGKSKNNDDIIKANFQTSRKVFLSFVNGLDLMMSSLLFDPTMSVNIIDLYSMDLESWVIL